MKTLFLLLIISFTLAEQAITAEFIEQIKSSGATWEVASYEESIFKGWTIDEVKAMLGTTMDFNNPVTVDTESDADLSLPENFDWRDENRKCIHPILDQGKCGSCWAFAATEVLSDRFCLKGRDIVLSPQDLVSCDPSNHGCQGGGDITPYMYMASSGVVSETCFPYASGDGQRRPCVSKCVRQGEPFTKYYCDGAPIIRATIERQKAELYQSGPVSTGFIVYKDFLTYKSGVYYATSKEKLGGHAVKVIGWGKQDGLNYWLCANSWSESWGDRGFFKIKMEDCNIMERGVSCTPYVK